MQFQFESLSDLVQMSGHGPYVWLAYGVTAVSLLYLVVAPSLRRRQLVKAISRQQRIEQAQAEVN